ncbi:hypothetical protein V5738_18290 [Salinisphaera sp. SPP-AMP-43]|uniref:F0F1 ATP synthase subunit B family protein n=1 Tax=Salinisphaera sp. SPP-AMP-43 TaxID=3121288 RepID=UPI003C6DC1B6
MLFNGFTMAAQIINFLVLIWLLKRFLYQPILAAIDAREQRIASELAEAAAQDAAAEDKRRVFEARSAELAERRADMLVEASAAAAAERDRLLSEARAEVVAERARRQASLRDEWQRTQAALGARLGEEALAIVRRVLADLGDAELESCIVRGLCRRLRQADASARAVFCQALVDDGGRARLRSAFELDPADRHAVQHALEACIDAPVVLTCERAPELIAGIELDAGGQRLAWHIADYLDVFEQHIDDVLKAAATTGTD